MKYEFRAPTLLSAVKKAIAGKDGRIENDNQVRTCKFVSQQIRQVNRTAAQAADEIESISEDLRREIEDFGYRDRWAALGLAAAAAGAITGVGGVIFAVRKLKRTVGVGASVIAGNQAYEEIDGVVDALSFVFPALQKIERGIDISGARRRYRQAKTTLQGLKSDMLKWERLYNQNQYSIVTETFGRGY